MFGSFTTLHKQNSNVALTNPVLMSGLYGFTSHLKSKTKTFLRIFTCTQANFVRSSINCALILSFLHNSDK